MKNNLSYYLSRKHLFEEVDALHLAMFRIVLGVLLTAEGWGAIATGWVKHNFIDTQYNFTVIGFEFLNVLCDEKMYMLFVLLGIAGVFITIGKHYRIAMTVYFILWTIAYLSQKTSYNNHYYLMVLLTGIMSILPANAMLSFDAKSNPRIASSTIPRIAYSSLTWLLTIVYLYAAFNKVHADWLLAKPIKIWFEGKSHYPIIGELLTQSWVHQVVAYGGIFYDALIIPLLLWRRTRFLALGLSLFFHLFNSAVFQIGIFPYMMLGIEVLFFSSQEIRKLPFLRNIPIPEIKPYLPARFPRANLAFSVFLAFMIIQTLLPLRHHLYPGPVNWNEEGHKLSWRMMLRSKYSYATFTIVDKESGSKTEINLEDYLTIKQKRRVAGQPDMIWQFAQYLREKHGDVEVFCKSKASLNGRALYDFVDSEIDLASAKWSVFTPTSWVLPLPED